tara:strand:+ start:685 stop:1152 length:468 start_codon:yes stop_codon:yes gene_type:complete
MTLRKLIQTSSYSSAFNILRSHYYPDEANEKLVEYSVAYRKVCEELMNLPFTSGSDFKIYITEKEDSLEGEKYIDVCLYDEENDELYGIDLTSWDELIDMEIYKATKMDNPTSLAHILWEITFYGFTNAYILDKRTELSEICEEKSLFDEINPEK